MKIPNEIKPNNLKEKLLAKFVQFSTTTTSHGIPRIVESSKFYQKSIWLVCWLISIGLCSFMVSQSIMEYLKYDVVTKIRIVTQDKIVFPQVSICNLNPILTQQGEQYLRKYGSESYYGFYIINDPAFNSTLRQSFAYTLDDALLYCQFRFKDCDPSSFVSYFDPNYGNCFYFNSDPESLLTVAREGDGLEIQIFLGPSDKFHNYIVSEKSILREWYTLLF